MDTDTLVRMANDIGQFFAAMPEREEALDGVVNHLRRYWAPAMRTALLARMDAGEALALDPLVVQALKTRRPQLLQASPPAGP
jgi:formate dehydrogenase subunit delta